MMIEKRFILAEDSNGLYSIFDTEDKEDEPLIYGARFGTTKIVDLLNEQQATISQLEEENEQLKNELRKEKSLREYSDSMIDVDLIVNIRFSNGEWKADVSVIDDE